MISEHEAEEKCVIVGSSTHNEHIERLWHDVHRSVMKKTLSTTECSSRYR